MGINLSSSLRKAFSGVTKRQETKAMAELTVMGRKLGVQDVVKLNPGFMASAVRTAKHDGADNVFFEMAKDTYVASGRGLNLKGIKPGAEVSFRGQRGAVTFIDDQINTASEPFKRLTKATKIAATPGAVVGGGVGFFAGTMGAASLADAHMSSVALTASAVGLMGGTPVLGAAVGAAIPGATVAAGAAAFGAFRQVDFHAVRAHGHTIL